MTAIPSVSSKSVRVEWLHDAVADCHGTAAQHVSSTRNLKELRMRRSKMLALIPLAMLGCGGGPQEFPTAPVTGQVLCNGEPIADVLVNFAPIHRNKKGESGRMGVGVAQEDGTFVVSTYGAGDGAVVGQHDVSVSSPHPEEFPHFHCNCETVGGKRPVMKVEVKADGENNFTINLPPKADPSAPSIKAKDLEDIEQSAGKDGKEAAN
jgi:hypothetical protein